MFAQVGWSSRLRRRSCCPAVSSLISALSLLAWAATASAECAWVLWGVPTGKGYDRDSTIRPNPIIDLPGGSEASVVQAYPTYDGCLGERTRRIRAAGETYVLGREVTVSPTGQRFFAVEELVCLPDTVDPRGPKGK